MRVAGPASGAPRDVLVDMAPVQALRLRLAAFERALEAGAFQPFPDGRAAAGPQDQRGALAAASGAEGVQLAHGPISSFDGRLPDYLSEALYTALNADDTAFRDFLAIFDKRLMKLRLAGERADIAVSACDANAPPGPSAMASTLRAVGLRKDDFRYLEVLAALLTPSRSLETLKRMLIWWCGRPVSVAAHFDIRSPVDTEHRTVLSARANGTNSLGKGALLGRFGWTNAGRLAVDIECASRADLTQLTGDSVLLGELKELISAFLRERTPVTVFARIKRAELDPPRLSARRTRAARLGAYTVMTPNRHPDRTTRIKLTEIYKRG